MKNFWLSYWDNVVVKVGSNVLVWNSANIEDRDYWINFKNIENVVNSVSYLMSLWLNVFLVSSWAVAVWRRECEKNGIIFNWKLFEDQKAFLAWNWQIRLMGLYRELFLQKGILVTQNLLTHRVFTSKNIFENLKNVWSLNISNRVVSIINENDVISREELKFSDNDQLAWLVSEAVKAKMLFLLSDIDWIYRDYWTDKESLIEEVRDIEEVRKYVINDEKKWWVWSWWMDSKLNVFQKMQDNWIYWVLANWWTKDIVKNILEWEKCKKTIFLAWT